MIRFANSLIACAFALLAAVPVFPAWAQNAGQACSAIAQDAKRLACFDAAFPAQAPTETVAVTIASNQLIPARPVGRGHARMRISCEGGTLSVAFDFAGQLVSATGDFAPITFLADAQTARTRTLSASPDNQALGFWSSGEAKAFLNGLEGVQNLSVRVTPVSQRSLNVRFNVDQLDETIAPVRQACE